MEKFDNKSVALQNPKIDARLANAGCSTQIFLNQKINARVPAYSSNLSNLKKGGCEIVSNFSMNRMTSKKL